jgi:hypothetical protein
MVGVPLSFQPKVADGFPNLFLDQHPDEAFPEEQGDDQGGDHGGGSPEGDVLEYTGTGDVEGFVEVCEQVIKHA